MNARRARTRDDVARAQNAFWLGGTQTPAALLPDISLPELDDEFRRAVVAASVAARGRIAAEARRVGLPAPDPTEALEFESALSGRKGHAWPFRVPGVDVGELVTIDELERTTGEARSTLSDWAASSRVTARKFLIGGRWRWVFLVGDVEHLIRVRDAR